MLVIEGDTLLSRDEGEAFPEFEHQALQAADEQLLQIGFQKMLSLRDTEKLQDIRVADDLFGFDTSGFGTGNLLFHSFLVSAGQQAVIEKRVDLAVELPDTPVFLDALVQVKITGGIARHLEKRAAMRPAQFITQRDISGSTGKTASCTAGWWP